MSCKCMCRSRMRCRIHARFVVIVSGEEQSVRVRVRGLRFGFLVRLRAPHLIRSQKVCMSRRRLVRMVVPSRRVSRSGILKQGVLLCLCLFVVLISLLCYLGQAVKLENNWDGCNWRKLTGLGCGFSGVPFQGRICFLPLSYLEAGLKRGRTTQRGRSQGSPRARPSYRATHGSAVLGTALVVGEGYRSPDEALVC